MIPTTISQKTLNLLFPQWQGSGITNELYNGAMLIYERLQNRAKFDRVPVDLDRTLKLKQDILGYSQILQQLSKAQAIIRDRDPDRLFVIGGDCSIDIAPISFLNQKYSGDLAVVWLDAHGDLNTPATSPSHHFHGMPLRLLLGEGDSKILQLFSSVLSCDRVFLVGARDFDLPEKDYLQLKNISLFTPKTLEHSCQNLIEAIAKLAEGIVNSNCHNLHIHCDLDVIDPQEFPFVKCPAEYGLSIKFVTQLLQQLQNRFNLVGFSITEFAPVKRQGLEKIDRLVENVFERLQHN